jgi:hypothetical protein
MTLVLGSLFFLKSNGIPIHFTDSCSARDIQAPVVGVVQHLRNRLDFGKWPRLASLVTFPAAQISMWEIVACIMQAPIYRVKVNGVWMDPWHKEYLPLELRPLLWLDDPALPPGFEGNDEILQFQFLLRDTNARISTISFKHSLGDQFNFPNENRGGETVTELRPRAIISRDVWVPAALWGLDNTSQKRSARGPCLFVITITCQNSTFNRERLL